MAHLRCDFRSEVLDMNTSMAVVLPDGGKMSSTRVVYLLHGLADNCSGWSRYTSVERYARKYGVALVIPEVQRSFYVDMASGLDYFTFVHDELREICMRFFGFSEERSMTYIMGLSMGGYGSLKCAFSTPLRYAGVAAFSPVTDIAYVNSDASDGTRREFDAIFGPSISPDDDLYDLLSRTDAIDIPPVYIACGESDARLFHSRQMESSLASKGVDVLFEHWAGNHNWDFWDEAVKRGFEYFFGTGAC